MPGEASDEDLLKEVASRADREAFTTLVMRHGRAVQRLARAIVGVASADDVSQEAFVRALRGAATFDASRGSGRTWLLSITRHTAFEMLRAARAHAHGDVIEAEPLMLLGMAAGWGAVDPELALEAAERREHLARSLTMLPAVDREVLVLRDIEGLSGLAVAEMLDLDLAATKSRLHRARLRLVAAMRAHEEGIVAEEIEAGGMRCREVLAVLSDYVDGEIGVTERVRVEHHLRACAVCERFGGRFGRVVHDLREKLGAEPAFDEALLTSIRNRLG